MIALLNRRPRSGRKEEHEHEEKEAAESLAGVEGEDGDCGLEGREDAAGFAQQYDVHPTRITDWKLQLLERSAVVFGESPAKESGPDIQAMQAKIRQLTLENDFLEKALTKAGLLSPRG